MVEAKKPITNRKRTPKKEVVAEVEAKEEVKVEEPRKKVAPKKIEKDELIPVMNNTTGRYGYIARSGFSFELEEYGDIVDVPFGELYAMRSSSQKRHLEDAFIIILDEEAVKELNYTKLYENVLDREGVEDILQDADRLEKAIKKMPIAMRETLVSVAKEQYKNRELRDLFVIEAIEKNLKIQLRD